MVAPVTVHDDELIAHVIRTEAAALASLSAFVPRMTHQFVHYVQKTTGKVVFSGLGKSGLLGACLAATFSSLGIPALSLHPVDALHGDSGVLQATDCLVLISKSGTGTELAMLAQYAQRVGAAVVVLTCSAEPLAILADLVVRLPAVPEADPYNLVPTSSLLVLLSYGHAVALACAARRGFSPTTFAQVHPYGEIGKQLKVKAGVLR